MRCCVVPLLMFGAVLREDNVRLKGMRLEWSVCGGVEEKDRGKIEVDSRRYSKASVAGNFLANANSLEFTQPKVSFKPLYYAIPLSKRQEVRKSRSIAIFHHQSKITFPSQQISPATSNQGPRHLARPLQYSYFKGYESLTSRQCINYRIPAYL